MCSRRGKLEGGGFERESRRLEARRCTANEVWRFDQKERREVKKREQLEKAQLKNLKKLSSF
jgi:hypothetical protein